VPDGDPMGARRGPDGVPDGDQTGAQIECSMGTRGEARRGGGRKDYLLLKEEMRCFVYVSCKSSSTSDKFNAKWM
jgi:hypothetical protein